MSSPTIARTGERPLDAEVELTQSFLEYRLPFVEGDGEKVLKHGSQSSHHLQRRRSVETDLVHGKVHIGVPRHDGIDDSELTIYIQPLPRRKGPCSDPSQEIVKLVED